MKEPKPQDYGISEEIIIKVNKSKERISNYMFSGLIGVGAIGGIYYFIRQFCENGITVSGVSIGIILGLLMGGTIGFTSVFFIGLPITSILESIIKDSKRVDQFEKACVEYKVWFYRTQENWWKSLNGFSFEKQVGELFRKLGYDVKFTPLVADEGIDLILIKNGEKTVVQCKNTTKPVSPSVLRDLYGTLIANQAKNAILVSASGCTKGSLKFMRDKPIRLITVREIIEMQKSIS